MPKKKKGSSRRPPSSGPSLSPTSTHRDPIMLEDGNPSTNHQDPQQNSILIDDETESQTQNPSLLAEEKAKQEDLVEIQKKSAILEVGLDDKGDEMLAVEESRKAAQKRKTKQRGGGAEKKLKQVENPISIDDDKEDLKEQDVKGFSKVSSPILPIEEETEPILVMESQNTQDEGKIQLEQLEDLDEGVDLGSDLNGELNEQKEEAEKTQEEGQGEEEKQMEQEDLEDNEERSTRNVSRRTAKKKKQQRAVLEEKLKQVENPISIEEDPKEIDNTDLVEDEEDSSKTQNPISVEEEKVDLIESQDTDFMEEEHATQSPHPRCEQEGDSIAKEFDFDELNHNNEEELQEQGEDEKQIQQEEAERTSLSPPLHDPPGDDGLGLSFGLDNQLLAPNVSRKPPKRKKLHARQRQALEKKLKLVRKNLQPIPFVPEKHLDFSKHEELFKRLGLWDFVNMQFDQEIRFDLLALLIVNYNSNLRYSTVNSRRIKVSRADLARALKLPVKKDKSNSLETSDFDSEVFSDESIRFLGEFLSNWILLHDDTWILPDEVVNWEKLVLKGQPHKVDWAGLIWFMVEKELAQARQIGKLYYASHIQCLMRSQRADIFEEETEFEVSMDGEEDGLDLKMGSLEDNQRQEFEIQQTELSLRQEKNDNEHQYREVDMMDYQIKEAQGGPAGWHLDRCNLNDTQNLENEHVMHSEDEEGYDPESKCTNLGRLSSTDFLRAMGTTSITDSPSLRFPGQSSGDLFHSRVDTHLNPSGTSLFGDDDIADHHTLSGHHKRMTNDASSMDFNFCLEQMTSWMAKAKGMYEEKEQACRTRAQEQLLFSQLQQQNQMLTNNLQKTRYDLQVKELENLKLDQELLSMSTLVEGYRIALKENRRLFSEYRQRNPEHEEPLYKDVGPGGLVLSVNEIERQRLEQEEEEKQQQEEEKQQRYMYKQMLENYEHGCLEIMESYKASTRILDKKLLALEDDSKLLKEIYAKRMVEEQ